MSNSSIKSPSYHSQTRSSSTPPNTSSAVRVTLQAGRTLPERCPASLVGAVPRRRPEERDVQEDFTHREDQRTKMAAEGTMAQVKLTRMENTQAWGFRMRGGSQVNMPLYIEHCGPNSRAARSGLAPGDIIVQICGNNVQGMSHDQAKGEVLRGGNDLDFVVLKGGMKNMPQRAAPAPKPRVEVVEEPTCRLGGPTFKQVKPKTYQVLESELPASGQAQARPASIFDRKRQERSGYLQAQGPTIQKAYGE